MTFLILLLVILVIIAMVKAGDAQGRIIELTQRIITLERQIKQFTFAPGGAKAAQQPPVEVAVPVFTPQHEPPPLPVVPPAITAKPEPVPVTKPAPAQKPVEWEQFMGAKLFAWVGGLALFLGVAFFVKYSFEHNLIPPEMSVAIGYLVGVGLLAGGVIMKRKETVVTAQTLCSTGILILYAVTFASHSFYHFAFFGHGTTFFLMTLITATAFLLAIRLDAVVVGILGIAGGFLTPVLLFTGQDAPLALFGYIALLDIGLLAVALRKRWNSLPVLGAIGTVLTQIGWIGNFFVAEKYFVGHKVLIAMAVFGGIEALFLAAAALAGRKKKGSDALSGSALAMGAVALLVSFFFLGFQPLGQQPVMLFGYVFLVDLGLVALVLLDGALATVEVLAGLVVFCLLAAWTSSYLSNACLYTALAFYLVFALFHSAAPVVTHRLRGTKLPWWCNSFPALSLLLVLMPIFKLPDLSILLWPLVLLIDMMAVILAVVTATLLPVLAVLLLTLVALGAWIFQIPAELTGLPTSLFLLGGFAAFFMLASTWASGKLLKARESNLAVQIPALSVLLPFLLLIMLTVRLPLANPSPVFGLAMLLVVLLMGIAKIMSIEALPAVGLASVVALEHVWHFHNFDTAHATLPLAWYAAFYLVFTAFPFLFHRQFAKSTVPWATAALAGPLHFYLVHQLVVAAYPGMGGMMGLLPAAFSIPALLGLVAVLKRTLGDSPARNSQLAWLGGAALFFITLIFPIQFDREWITIGWALEGAALCWLFHRVPHRGLPVAGVGLLVASFSRLAMNPAVLGYHSRAAMPVLNWYLYAYGVVGVCLFAGAWLLAPPCNRVLETNAPPMLVAMGTLLGFLLVNIEIADYFMPPGAQALTFEFSGNFARDMSYSIAWALFALLMLVIGISRRLAPVRYAGIGLLVATLTKLFLHDLSQLDQLYRIGAFIVVAVIAIFASFLYQRFLGVIEKSDEPLPVPPPIP